MVSEICLIIEFSSSLQLCMGEYLHEQSTQLLLQSDSHVTKVKIVISSSHLDVGDNSVSSNHSKSYNKDNILHCLFSLEKILKMPESCCVKNCSNSTKNSENVSLIYCQSMIKT